MGSQNNGVMSKVYYSIRNKFVQKQISEVWFYEFINKICKRSKKLKISLFCHLKLLVQTDVKYTSGHRAVCWRFVIQSNIRGNVAQLVERWMVIVRLLVQCSNRQFVLVSLGKTLNANFPLGPSCLPVVVAHFD